MRRIFFLFVCSVLLLPLHAQMKLSDEAKISILTSEPHDGEVFTVYGHAAIRVNDPESDFDIIFNYGIFDFSKPNFMYRFAKGETDYKLGISDYLNYVIEYQMRGSDITEQVLNLTQQEKEEVFKALILNYQPENRTYRYNFFFDNCATRLPVIIEKYVDGEVVYHNQPEPKTFRDMINYCTRNHPWLTFGCDLVVGSPSDRMATAHEMMFLPFYLEKELSRATIDSADGSVRPLVSETHVVEAAEVDTDESSVWSVLTPLVCAWILFAVVAGLSYIEWRKRKYFRLLDVLLFTVAGLAGVVIFFLSFISVHPSMWPNWNVIWLHPLHLVGVVLFCLKKTKKAAYCYHFINFAALTLMLLGWFVIPQHLNAAFIPLVATLWLRSAMAVFVRKLRV